jgi:uncharacterized membrane protein
VAFLFKLMKLHEIYPYSKPFFYIGAILGFIDIYLDNTKKADTFIIYALLISGFVFMLLSFKKPKESKSDEL